MACRVTKTEFLLFLPFFSIRTEITTLLFFFLFGLSRNMVAPLGIVLLSPAPLRLWRFWYRRNFITANNSPNFSWPLCCANVSPVENPSLCSRPPCQCTPARATKCQIWNSVVYPNGCDSLTVCRFGHARAGRIMSFMVICCASSLFLYTGAYRKSTSG